MKVSIDCALSNATACVCRDEDGELTKCELKEGDTFGGFCHPGGEAAVEDWTVDHPDLKTLLTYSLVGTSGRGVTANGDEDGDLVLEDDDPIDALNEPEAFESISLTHASGETEQVDSDVPEQALVDAGVPSQYLDELLGAGLDTPAKVLEHDDLTKVHGIGKKSRDAILKGMSAE